MQGYKRIDLVVLTYTKDEGTGVEDVALEVIKGTPSENNPSVPSYVTGDILNNGELKNQMPLYKIPFDGLSIGEPVKMFATVPTMQTMKEELDAEVEAKIAEMDDAFAELEAGIDDKIAEAGKPLSSNASDWGMIANYGEYSADAKTVGEELDKVNESLTAHQTTITKSASGAYVEISIADEILALGAVVYTKDVIVTTSGDPFKLISNQVSENVFKSCLTDGSNTTITVTALITYWT